MKKLITIGGVILGLAAYTQASVPCFKSWNDRRLLDARIAIGKTVYKVTDLMGDQSETLKNLFAKSTDANSMVYFGYYLPIALFAAASNSVKSGTDSKTYLQLLLEGTNDMIIPFETSLGWTALHEAALNSDENKMTNIMLLQQDNRLDINRKNREGDTALMVAIKAGNYVAARKIIELYGEELDLESTNKRGETPALLVKIIEHKNTVNNITNDTKFTELQNAFNTVREPIMSGN
ncbi:MAG: ankyrin repeat domain-containing protein [Verrucomicrobiota bacterium]|nr:MAG: ankyrin repeat domain-containing protein [Verrucomicrobiota bacterium]